MIPYYTFDICRFIIKISSIDIIFIITCIIGVLYLFYKSNIIPKKLIIKIIDFLKIFIQGDFFYIPKNLNTSRSNDNNREPIDNGFTSPTRNDGDKPLPENNSIDENHEPYTCGDSNDLSADDGIPEDGNNINKITLDRDQVNDQNPIITNDGSKKSLIHFICGILVALVLISYIIGIFICDEKDVPVDKDPIPTSSSINSTASLSNPTLSSYWNDYRFDNCISENWKPYVFYHNKLYKLNIPINTNIPNIGSVSKMACINLVDYGLIANKGFGGSPVTGLRINMDKNKGKEYYVFMIAHPIPRNFSASYSVNVDIRSIITGGSCIKGEVCDTDLFIGISEKPPIDQNDGYSVIYRGSDGGSKYVCINNMILDTCNFASGLFKSGIQLSSKDSGITPHNVRFDVSGLDVNIFVEDVLLKSYSLSKEETNFWIGYNFRPRGKVEAFISFHPY